MLSTPMAIKKISVKNLFGVYDYILAPQTDSKGVENIIILYGDNGSGKTTILKAIFNLLAPEMGRGYKGRVASTPFRRFEIEFMNNDTVWAERQGKNLTGSFTMGLTRGQQKPFTFNFIADSNNITTARAPEDIIQTRNFLEKLRGLNISLYMLSDDRTIQLAGRERTPSSFVEDETDESIDRNDNRIRYFPGFRRQGPPEDIAQVLLGRSIKRAEEWIQTQVMHSSSLGESNVNTLYSEILRRLTTASQPQESPREIKIAVESRIRNLVARSKSFNQYGLVPEFSGKEILAVLSPLLNNKKIETIYNVLHPYLESVEKKLDAMKSIHDQIDSLVHLLNSFLLNKRIEFKVHDGFSIITNGGEKLQPKMLSSGERHLLLLFCNTLISLNRPSIFIIDEPEISLNIKWQRRLISSLLDCVGKNPVQYIFATHSIEVLTQYKANVIKLISR